jgi:thiol-disulfide isomerase/thioredoxin
MNFPEGPATLSSEALAGKVVVINYWAEWCPPCIKELPELNVLHLESKDDVVVLGVNYDGIKGEELQLLMKKLFIQFPVLVNDPARDFSLPAVNVLPTTFLLDQHGQFAASLVGPQTLEDLQQAVNKLAFSLPEVSGD